MDSLFPLPLFPPASLDSSVTTTVWVGVLVVAFFNLRWGWVFSGLVVPGYFVPLILTKPVAASVILLQAVLVYALVRGLTELKTTSGFWSSFFGRDRFVALVMVSVLVRLVLDGWALPMLGEFLTSELGWSFDYRSELHSFGLVVVALLANQLWKPGLRNGLLQFATTTGVSVLIVRFVLVEWTNFDLGGIEYMYEDIAASILASPKAYIILLTTAFIASRLNLRYGWEYSGVLIPALLALQWYQPTKLLSSLVEAWVVLLVSSFLLGTRLFRGRTIEKASKVALFFTVSFFYKYLIAFAALLWAPDLKVSDVYGFGYLLSTLLAVKMHEKNLGLRMTRFTLQTTLVSAVVALLVGFAITLIPRPLPAEPRAGEVSAEVVEGSESFAAAQLASRVAIYSGKRRGGFAPPTPEEVRGFSRGVELLERYVRQDDEHDLESAARYLAAIDLAVERIGDDYVQIREIEPWRGWGYFFLRRGESRELLIEAPRPLDEWATAEAAAGLFEKLNARALAVAGAAKLASKDGSSDAALRSGTLFQAFHRIFSADSTVQVRGLPTVSLPPADAPPVGGDAVASGPVLHVKGKLPDGLDLRALESTLGDYEILWSAADEPSLQWRTTRSGFAELQLDQTARRQLLMAAGAAAAVPVPTLYREPIEGYLHSWLLAGKGRLAERGSELYVPPRLEDLLFFDEEVLQPLFEITQVGYRDGELTTGGQAAWRQAAIAASHYGYEVIWYRHAPSSRDYLVLQERDSPELYWGTYVFRLGAARPFVLEVPRPRLERRTFEVGVSLFERLGGAALAIAGSHPYANADASSDLVRPENKASLFNLVNQVTLREAGEEPYFVLLCRAFARTGDPNEPPAMLALLDGAANLSEAGPLGQELVEILTEDGIEPQFVNGSRLSASYEVGQPPQARYIDQTVGKRLAVLWLSESTRGSFRQLGEETFRDDHFGLLGIPTVEADVPQWLANATSSPAVASTSAERAAELLDLLSYYVESSDLMALRRVVDEWPELRLRRIIDRSSPRAFLWLESDDGSFAGAVNLQLRAVGDPLILAPESVPTEAGNFLQQRRAILLVRSGP